MATKKRQRVWVECLNHDQMLFILFLASASHLRREELPCGQSPLNTNSADMEFSDFREEEDLNYLRRLPGVVAVGTYESDVPFPDPEQTHQWVLSTPWAHHAAT